MRRIRTLVVAVLVGVLAAAQPPAVASAAPPYTIEERAAAIASPALVFIDLGFRGYLRDRTSGAVLHDDPIIVRRRCSGFVVSGDGHVVAPTQCVQVSESSQRSTAASILADARIRAKELTSDQRSQFITEVRNTTNFTGENPDDPSTLDSVTAQMYIATTALAQATVINARIVETLPVDAGDVALLQLNSTGLPVARLLTTAPVPGTPIVQVAFTRADPEGNRPDHVVRSRTGLITGRFGSDAPALYQIDGDLGSASNGGMAVDTSGSVIGMITSASGRGNTILVGADQIRVLLTNAGVENALTPTDEAYRRGLDAYFAGHYSDAIAELDTVLAQQPNNLPAQTYRTFATERLAIEGDPPASLNIVPIVAIIVTIVLVLGIVVLLIRGLRARARARELDEYGDVAPYPAMLPPAPAPRAIESSAHVPAAPASGAPVSAAPDASWAPGWTQEGWTPPAPRPDTASAPTGNPVPPPGTGPAPTPGTGPAPTPGTGPAPTPPPAEGTASALQQPTDAWPAVTIWRSPNDGSPPPPPPPPPPGPAPSTADPAAAPPPTPAAGAPPPDRTDSTR